MFDYFMTSQDLPWSNKTYNNLHVNVLNMALGISNEN